MPKPPAWLPWLGPPLSGVTAGLAGRHIDSFWVLLLAAVAAGFAPIIAYRLWKRAHHK